MHSHSQAMLMIQTGFLKSIDICLNYFLTIFAILQLKNSAYKHNNILFIITIILKFIPALIQL